MCAVLALNVIMCSFYYFFDRVLFHHNFHHDDFEYNGICMTILFILSYTFRLSVSKWFRISKYTTHWILPPLELLLEYWIEHVTFGLLYVMLTFPFKIFYRGVPGFATGCPCCLILASLIILYILHSTSELSFCIDIVLTLYIILYYIILYYIILYYIILYYIILYYIILYYIILYFIYIYQYICHRQRVECVCCMLYQNFVGVRRMTHGGLPYPGTGCLVQNVGNVYWVCSY